MFSHIMLGSNNMEKSKAFYDATLSVFGYPEGVIDEKGRCLYINPQGVFIVTKPIDGKPATHGNGMTIGFKANSTEQVDAWHKAGIAQGGTPCEDPPGVRSNQVRSLYLAYLRDPSGNKICATHVIG